MLLTESTNYVLALHLRKMYLVILILAWTLNLRSMYNTCNVKVVPKSEILKIL